MVAASCIVTMVVGATVLTTPKYFFFVDTVTIGMDEQYYLEYEIEWHGIERNGIEYRIESISHPQPTLGISTRTIPAIPTAHEYETPTTTAVDNDSMVSRDRLALLICSRRSPTCASRLA